MAELKTPEQWWALVDSRWSDFEQVAGLVVGSRRQAFDGPAQFEDSRLQVADPQFWEKMTAAKDRRDHVGVHGGFEAMWAGAPDRGDIHDWPGWMDLCDCCSEIWVFDPPELQ